jgi:hypothetical protein
MYCDLTGKLILLAKAIRTTVTLRMTNNRKFVVTTAQRTTGNSSELVIKSLNQVSVSVIISKVISQQFE